MRNHQAGKGHYTPDTAKNTVAITKNDRKIPYFTKIISKFTTIITYPFPKWKNPSFPFTIRKNSLRNHSNPVYADYNLNCPMYEYVLF